MQGYADARSGRTNEYLTTLNADYLDGYMAGRDDR